jgi:hypothetical protein
MIAIDIVSIIKGGFIIVIVKNIVTNLTGKPVLAFTISVRIHYSKTICKKTILIARHL